MSLSTQPNSVGGFNPIDNDGFSLTLSPGTGQTDPNSQTPGMGNQQQSPLERLVDVLVQAMTEGQGQGQNQGDQVSGYGGSQQGKGSGLGNMLEDLIERMQQNGTLGQTSDHGNGGPGPTGGSEGQMGMEELMKMLLMAMLQVMMKGNQDNGQGDGLGNSQSGIEGSQGAGGPGGGNGPLGLGGGMGGQGPGGMSIQDLDRSLSLVDTGNSLMQGAGENALGNAISPTRDGGGQVTGPFKDLLMLVANMMDNNSGAFGQASGLSSSSSTGLDGGQSGQNGPSIELSFQMG